MEQNYQSANPATQGYVHTPIPQPAITPPQSAPPAIIPTSKQGDLSAIEKSVDITQAATTIPKKSKKQDEKQQRTYKLNDHIVALIETEAEKYGLEKSDYVALAVYATANKWSDKQHEKFLLERNEHRKMFGA
ncbi:MAG: hypothetical protein FWG90_08435 [Oscillospiraceae bacterium]|nr:hypothetical protein [Oscillospiraceae bacterium]